MPDVKVQVHIICAGGGFNDRLLAVFKRQKFA